MKPRSSVFVCFLTSIIVFTGIGFSCAESDSEDLVFTPGGSYCLLAEDADQTVREVKSEIILYGSAQYDPDDYRVLLGLYRDGCFTGAYEFARRYAAWETTQMYSVYELEEDLYGRYLPTEYAVFVVKAESCSPVSEPVRGRIPEERLLIPECPTGMELLIWEEENQDIILAWDREGVNEAYEDISPYLRNTENGLHPSTQHCYSNDTQTYLLLLNCLLDADLPAGTYETGLSVTGNFVGVDGFGSVSVTREFPCAKTIRYSVTEEQVPVSIAAYDEDYEVFTGLEPDTRYLVYDIYDDELFPGYFVKDSKLHRLYADDAGRAITRFLDLEDTFYLLKSVLKEKENEIVLTLSAKQTDDPVISKGVSLPLPELTDLHLMNSNNLVYKAEMLSGLYDGICVTNNGYEANSEGLEPSYHTQVFYYARSVSDPDAEWICLNEETPSYFADFSGKGTGYPKGSNNPRYFDSLQDRSFHSMLTDCILDGLLADGTYELGVKTREDHLYPIYVGSIQVAGRFSVRGESVFIVQP